MATKQQQAQEQLQSILSDGEPHNAHDVIAQIGPALDIAPRTIQAAANQLGVTTTRAYREGKRGVNCWQWSLPKTNVLAQIIGVDVEGQQEAS